MNTDELPPPMHNLFEESPEDDEKTIGVAHPDEFANYDAECLKKLLELNAVVKGNQYTPVSAKIWVPFDFGFDLENDANSDNRNRLEETLNQLEKVLAEDIVVPGCQFAGCKRANDGVRIKAYWAEPAYDERARRTEIHILLHLCKFTFKEVDVPQIIVLCAKREGDIFQYVDIVRQLQTVIENK